MIDDATRLLLDQHFTGSHVEPITSGIELDGGRSTGPLDLVVRRRRDPAFRASMLRAYG